MKNLILHPTDISQWYALVNEAEVATHMVLHEDTESYLVFLLQRFMQTTQLLESIIAMDFLESMNAFGKRQIELLRDVGDKSLLLCGLFPGIATRHHVTIEYFSDMGKTAYLTIGESQEKSTAELYLQLGAQFLMMQQILQAMRGENFSAFNNDMVIHLNSRAH